jgi:hypothetical protein
MSTLREKVSDDSLLKLLACGATVESTARKLGVTERTVYRRLAKPKFRQRLQELRQEAMERNANTASALAPEALKTLLDLMSPGQPPAERRQAAATVLKMGIEMQGQADLARRVATLEQEGSRNGLDLLQK